VATTPTLKLCDDLVTALTAAWSPVSPDGVERCYFKRIGDPDDANTKLTGRKVFIFPTAYATAGATRGENEYTHRVSVLTVERFPAATPGDPTTAWVDDRVDFVHTYVVKGFDYSEDGPPSFNRKLLTLSAEVAEVCDPEKLVTGNRLFYCLVDLVFSELVAN